MFLVFFWWNQKYHKFVLCRDLNAEQSEPGLSEFLLKYDSKNLVIEKICFKNPENPRCIDLFLVNSVQSFQNTFVLAAGVSDFHKMILTVLKTSFTKSAPKKSVYRNYKNFNSHSFKIDLKKQLKYTEFYESFENVFLNVLQKHAPLKTKVVRAPYVSRTLRKAIMKRSELERKYLKNRINENKIRYKKQKNFCSKLYKK